MINASGIVSVDGDGTWVCTGGSKHKTERLPDPVIFFSSIRLFLSCCIN